MDGWFINMFDFHYGQADCVWPPNWVVHLHLLTRRSAVVGGGRGVQLSCQLSGHWSFRRWTVVDGLHSIYARAKGDSNEIVSGDPFSIHLDGGCSLA